MMIRPCRSSLVRSSGSAAGLPQVCFAVITVLPGRGPCGATAVLVVAWHVKRCEPGPPAGFEVGLLDAPAGLGYMGLRFVAPLEAVAGPHDGPLHGAPELLEGGGGRRVAATQRRAQPAVRVAQDVLAEAAEFAVLVRALVVRGVPRFEGGEPVGVAPVDPAQVLAARAVVECPAIDQQHTRGRRVGGAEHRGRLGLELVDGGTESHVPGDLGGVLGERSAGVRAVGLPVGADVPVALLAAAGGEFAAPAGVHRDVQGAGGLRRAEGAGQALEVQRRADRDDRLLGDLDDPLGEAVDGPFVLRPVVGQLDQRVEPLRGVVRAETPVVELEVAGAAGQRVVLGGDPQPGDDSAGLLAFVAAAVDRPLAEGVPLLPAGMALEVAR
ncbi:hypothetical protein GCM10025734_49020 [Kitasatospora paranensis]